LEFTRLVFTL